MKHSTRQIQNHNAGNGFSNYNYHNLFNDIYICTHFIFLTIQLKKEAVFKPVKKFFFTKYSRPLFTCLGYTAKLTVSHKPFARKRTTCWLHWKHEGKSWKGIITTRCWRDVRHFCRWDWARWGDRRRQHTNASYTTPLCIMLWCQSSFRVSGVDFMGCLLHSAI